MSSQPEAGHFVLRPRQRHREGRCYVVADWQRGSTRPAEKAVLRNRWTAAAGLASTVAAVGFGVFLAVAVDFGDGVNSDVLDRSFGASVMLTFATFLWHLAVRPSVVVERGGCSCATPSRRTAHRGHASQPSICGPMG